MYSPAHTQQLQQQTNMLLQRSQCDVKDIEILRAVLRFHEYRYYVMNNPLVSDGEYDKLYKMLEQLEQQHPELLLSDSPTQRVAKGLGNDFTKVQHLVPMLSLENSYNADDLLDWDRRCRELTGLQKITYCAEPKFDGAGISLVYENDTLVRGATRGDGVVGEDITTNIRQIRSIPLHAAFSAFGIKQIEIRGEVLMNKTHFKKFNDQLAEEGLPPLANPRNAAAGTLRIKNAQEVAKRNLEAFLYHISYFVEKEDGSKKAEALQHHSSALQLLWELGFRSPEQEKKVFDNIEAVIAWCKEYEDQRDSLPYEIDGMVIKVNDLSLQEKMGMTTHHPRWAIAYKFKARQATSKLRSVEFQVGRTGAVTPVAKIDPVHIGGVMVGSISLHNQDFIAEKDLRIGDTVLVERAGDVIPYIVKSMHELRNGEEEPIQFPTTCPVCAQSLHKTAEEAVWRCTNQHCPAQVVERISHFVSKDAMDIRGLGAANIEKFFDLGYLSDIPSIYQLPFDAIRKLEGFGNKSIENLQQAIEQSKKQPLHRLITALGIRFVGETTAKTLAQHIHHLLDLKNMNAEDLQQLEDIGPRVAESICDFFSDSNNLHMLETLEKLGLNLQQEDKQVTHGSLEGISFLFTGTLPTLKRSDAEQMVEENGGTILGGVSAKLQYLVVGDDAGSKLEKAKKISTIRIIDEAAFLKMIGK